MTPTNKTTTTATMTTAMPLSFAKRLSTTTLLLFSCLCLLTTVVVQAERFQVYDLNGDNPYIENEQGDRFLQSTPSGTQGTTTGTGGIPVDDRGTLSSINATVNTCDTTAFKTFCNINTVVNANDGTGVNMAITVTCDLTPITAFDFRRATGCQCGVDARDAAGNPKACFCTVCPFGFGRSPVSVECPDEFIIGECTSLDCGFACNGTCNFGCDDSASAGCEFCENNIFAPTSAPTGTGQGGGPSNGGPTIGDSAAALGYHTQNGVLLFAAALGGLMLLV